LFLRILKDAGFSEKDFLDGKKIRERAEPSRYTAIETVSM